MATPTSLPATFVAGNVLTAAQMNDLRGAFRILQVVSTAKTDTFSASLAAATDSAATVSVTITPTSATSKILVIADLAIGYGHTGGGVGATLYRAGSVVTGATGDAAGSRTRSTSGVALVGGNDAAVSSGFHFLDSPATTSATTYDVRLWHNSSSSKTIYMNRGSNDADAGSTHRSISTLTAIEVSA